MKARSAPGNFDLDDDNDDMVDGFGQQIGPSLPKPEPVDASKKGEITDLRMIGTPVIDYDDG
jgi:hypothetical protein